MKWKWTEQTKNDKWFEKRDPYTGRLIAYWLISNDHNPWLTIMRMPGVNDGVYNSMTNIGGMDWGW